MKTTVYTCSVCGTQEESLPMPEALLELGGRAVEPLKVYPLPRGWMLVPVADLEVADDIHCRGCVALRERLVTTLAELEADTDCMCSFEGCSGTGVAHCSPPCGGDLCICVCGGETDCGGCENCDTAVDENCGEPHTSQGGCSDATNPRTEAGS